MSMYTMKGAAKVARALALGVALLWPAQSVAQDDGSLWADAIERGYARVALGSAPPWAFITPTGEIKGHLVEMTQAAAARLGVEKLEATATSWDSMIPGLLAGRFDMLPGGLNITKERCELVIFSAPLIASRDSLYVIAGNPLNLEGYASVAAHPTARLAVLTGTTQERVALGYGVDRSRLVGVPDTQAGVAAVTGGRADAFALGEYSVTNFADHGLDRIIGHDQPLNGAGVIFKKEDRDARDAFNRELAVLRADGTMQNSYETWGFDNWDVLEKLTKAADIIDSCE